MGREYRGRLDKGDGEDVAEAEAAEAGRELVLCRIAETGVAGGDSKVFNCVDLLVGEAVDILKDAPGL